jgi:TPR repeat protein
VEPEMTTKLKMIAAAVLISLLAMPFTAAAQDYKKGWDAYYRHKDYATAMKEWRPLAEHGHAKAQYGLGLLYSSGDGVPENHGEATKWFKLAAKQGHVSSQHILGINYESGKFIPRNYIEAYMWYNLAAESGDKLASGSRLRLAEKMTSENIEKAQSMTKECMNSGYKNCGE